MDDIRDQLQLLRDEREITNRLALFARLIDDRQWERLDEVFAQDLTFDYGAGESAGLPALRATMSGFLNRCGGTQHLIGSLLVEADGDRATTRAYVQARHQAPGDVTGPVFDSSGEYFDAWARGDAGWRIIRREARWMAHSGDPGIINATPEVLG